MKKKLVAAIVVLAATTLSPVAVAGTTSTASPAVAVRTLKEASGCGSRTAPPPRPPDTTGPAKTGTQVGIGISVRIPATAWVKVTKTAVVLAMTNTGCAPNPKFDQIWVGPGKAASKAQLDLIRTWRFVGDFTSPGTLNPQM